MAPTTASHSPPLRGSRGADCFVAQYTTPASDTRDTTAPIQDAREPRRGEGLCGGAGSGACGGAGRGDAGAGVSMPGMMADDPSGTLMFMPVARQIDLPGEADAWARLGFAPGAPVGEVRMQPAAARLELAVEGLTHERPDGLAIVAAEAGPAEPGAHPNGAAVVDHVVGLTDDLGRTLAALERAGLEVRRIRVPPEAPVRQSFIHLRSLIVEVEGDVPALWGVTVAVADLDACARELGPLLGAPRDAVQAGRRIATVRP